MAYIKITDLSVTGAELFADSESYLSEVSDNDALIVKGGTIPLIALGLAAAGLSYKIVHEWTT